jgi:hypothetical protein
MKRDESKKKEKTQGLVYGLFLILQYGFHQTTIFYCINIGPKGCKLASLFNEYPFPTLGPS